MRETVVLVPDELPQALEMSPEQVARHISQMAALKMFETGQISAGKAAELAGLTRAAFSDLCARYRVPVDSGPQIEVEASLRAEVEALRGLHG